MKVKVLIGALVVLIVLNLATIGSFVYLRWRAPRPEAAVWSPGPPVESGDTRSGTERPRPPGRFRPTTEERRQLKALLVDFRRQTEDLRRKVYEDESRVFELMQREEVPRAEVDSLLQQISTSRLEMGRLAVDKLIESKAYLSPRQQQRFFDSILQTRSGGHRHRGWPPGNRRGFRGGMDRRDEGR